MKNGMRLIDANALQLEPDPVGNIMNGVLFMGRSTGKTLQAVKYCLKAMIDKAPTIDAVEVVRCKDCKHYSSEMCWNYQWWNDDHTTWVNDDDFCSYGERRHDENTD